MRIIKDNSNKEIKAKCKLCKSKMKVKLIELKIGFMGRRYIECPVCKEDIWID